MGKINMPVIPLTAKQVGAAASSHNHAADDINSGVLPVSRGGTGRSTLSKNYALVGDDDDTVGLELIVNIQTVDSCAATSALVTANTLRNYVAWSLGRTVPCSVQDIEYTTYKARGIAFVTAVPSSMVKGTAAFVYA